LTGKATSLRLIALFASPEFPFFLRPVSPSPFCSEKYYGKLIAAMYVMIDFLELKSV